MSSPVLRARGAISGWARLLRRAVAASAVCASLAGFSPTSAGADEWLVYIDGGIVPIEGGWSEQRGRVVFTRAGGTLSSVRFEDVVLPASTFITYQLDGGRRVPPRASVEESAPPAADVTPTPCQPARLLQLHTPESSRSRSAISGSSCTSPASTRRSRSTATRHSAGSASPR